MNRKLLDIAVAGARAGADIVQESAGHLTGFRTKSSGVDLVTDIDVASGVAVVLAIREMMPNASFIVEEPEVYDLTSATLGQLHDAEVWVIDPLDGTTSFVHGYPCYSVSVACVRDGVPVTGAVLNIATGELYTGSVGQGAFLGEWRLRVSEVADIPEALIATGFPYDRGATLDRQLRIFSKVIRTAHDIRRDGSAAVDCCQVAAGRVDAFWELALRPWDMAAGVCIMREAGATVTDAEGVDWTPNTTDIVAANPRLHEKLLEVVASA